MRHEDVATAGRPPEAPVTPGRGDEDIKFIAARRRRRQRRDVTVDRTASLVLAITIISLAELSARFEVISPFIIPAPSRVVATLWSGLTEGVYLENTVSTLVAAAAGFVLASVSAIVVAGLLTSTERLERVFLPFIVAFQCMPKVAIAPLVVLWLGFGQNGKVAVVTLICFFPITINALEGMRIRDRDQFNLLQSLGASRFQQFRFLRIPGALPYIFAGLHIGVIFALIGAVIAELVGSRAGLGYVLLQEKASFNVPGVFAILIILMVIGLILHGAMMYAERKIAFWASDVSKTIGT